MAQSLNFTTQNTRRIPIRTAPAKYLTSKIRGIIECSEGQRPADVFVPLHFLPVYFTDVELADGIVIPKGTIVSALAYNDREGQTTSPIAPPASGATVYVGEDNLTAGANTWSANIDSSYWGYDEHVAGLLTICNGGIDIAGSHALEEYSALDVTHATIKVDGNYAAVGDDTPGRLANYPIGIVTYDVYQDIRGKYLNYEPPWSKWGILDDWYIAVPYFDNTVNLSRWGSMNGATATTNVEGTATTANYAALYRQHQFIYNHNGGTNAPLRVGSLVCSDSFGKFRTQHAALDSSFSATAEPWTAHTVGRVIALDNRFPKDHLDVVDTYPGSMMPGTETGGLPLHLFTFVRDYITNRDSAVPSISTIVNAVRSGAFGMARIQLHIG